MDIAGTNHWLPAYGFQQPTQLNHHDRDTDGTFIVNKFLIPLFSFRNENVYLLVCVVWRCTRDMPSFLTQLNFN